MSTLGDWIKDKYGSQVAFAEAMGVTQSRVSKWLSGYEPVPDVFQKKLLVLKFKGPYPREERAQEAEEAAGASVGYATIEEVAELRGAMKAHVEYLERALEKMGEAVRELALQLREEQEKNRGALGEGSGRPR